MSVRQYIGARYVTKIYENTLDPSSAEWQAGVNYEPLTMVTYNYGSYLSKKQVPASVGDPASNPTYWAQTGFYNGQILSLQAQIDAINAILSPITTEKKVLCIGDSYGMKITQNWPYHLKNFLGLDSDHFTNACVTNSGFVGNTGYATFLEQIQNASDKDTYTDIVIIGGFNDAYDSNGNMPSSNALYTAIGDTVAYIKANYPNVSNVYLGCPAFVLTDGPEFAKIDAMRTNINKVKSIYCQAAGQTGMSYISELDYTLHTRSAFNTSDYTYGCVFHPSSAGNKLIAQAVSVHMQKGTYSVIMEAATTTVSTFETGYSGNVRITARQYNDSLVVKLLDGGIATTGTALTAAAQNTWTKICDIPAVNNFNSNHAGNSFYTKAIASTSNSETLYGMIQLFIYDSALYIKTSFADFTGYITQVDYQAVEHMFACDFN